MNIGITAQNSKKSLMEDFCIAYKGILSAHDIYATYSTGQRVEDVTGLRIRKFLPGDIGGDQQFTDMVARGDMDMVIYFYNPYMVEPYIPDIYEIVRACDQYNIPLATNIASAEMLIMGLANGDLDWRLNIRKDEDF